MSFTADKTNAYMTNNEEIWYCCCFRSEEQQKSEIVKSLLKEFSILNLKIADKRGFEPMSPSNSIYCDEYWFLNLSPEFEARLRNEGITLSKCLAKEI